METLDIVTSAEDSVREGTDTVKSLLSKLDNASDAIFNSRDLYNFGERLGVSPPKIGLEKRLFDLLKSEELHLKDSRVRIDTEIASSLKIEVFDSLFYHIFSNLIGNIAKYASPELVATIKYRRIWYRGSVRPLLVSENFGETPPYTNTQLMIEGVRYSPSFARNETGKGNGLAIMKKACEVARIGFWYEIDKKSLSTSIHRFNFDLSKVLSG